MLKSLYIKNYALINELSIEFNGGLTILTGETGAGKSIIIDALSMILGERADVGVVRKETDKAIVEAVFILKQKEAFKKLFSENDIDFQDELILRREISVKGQSRCFINDSPVTVGLLKQAGDFLVDLHGQHEHQSLLRAETHIEMLDDFCGLNDDVLGFSKKYYEALAVLKKIDTLQNQKQTLEEKRSLYEFQLKEINTIDPKEGEPAQLTSELKILENAETLALECDNLSRELYNGDNSLIDLIGIAQKRVTVLQKIDSAFESAHKELESVASIIDELTKFIRDYRTRIEFRPERLEEIRERLGRISLLQKKYGGSMQTLLSAKQKAEQELSLAENFDAEINSLKAELKQARENCSGLAQKLSKKREEGAKKLGKKIEQTLKQLGIPNAKLETKFVKQESQDIERALVNINNTAYQANSNGIDQIEFYLSTNVGEDVKPLVKVASGGEISRIMLALKMNLVGEQSVPLLIFDEIDVGISGRIAQSVGLAMKGLAQTHQVIAITHLPQIAAVGNTHFVVEKENDGKRVATGIRKLSTQERIVEVARLLSGEEVTEAGLRNAKELIEFQVN